VELTGAISACGPSARWIAAASDASAKDVPDGRAALARGSGVLQHDRDGAVTEQHALPAGAERPDLAVLSQRAAGIEEAEAVGVDQEAGGHDDPLGAPGADHGGGISHRTARGNAGVHVNPVRRGHPAALGDDRGGVAVDVAGGGISRGCLIGVQSEHQGRRAAVVGAKSRVVTGVADDPGELAGKHRVSVQQSGGPGPAAAGVEPGGRLERRPARHDRVG
jgi:hypothetical protein